MVEMAIIFIINLMCRGIKWLDQLILNSSNSNIMDNLKLEELGQSFIDDYGYHYIRRN